MFGLVTKKRYERDLNFARKVIIRQRETIGKLTNSLFDSEEKIIQLQKEVDSCSMFKKGHIPWNKGKKKNAKGSD